MLKDRGEEMNKEKESCKGQKRSSDVGGVGTVCGEIGSFSVAQKDFVLNIILHLEKYDWELSPERTGGKGKNLSKCRLILKGHPLPVSNIRNKVFRILWTCPDLCFDCMTP